MHRIRFPSFFQVVLVCLVVLCFEGKAWAYADPGSGTLVWQMLLAASVGFMFNLRRIMIWVRSVVGKKNPGGPQPE